MSLIPVDFGHAIRGDSYRSQATGFAITIAGLTAIAVAFYFGVEMIGWRDTGRYAWEAAALLFLVPFASEAVQKLARHENIDWLVEWTPRIELFFIAAFAGSWAMAMGPALTSSEKIPQMALAGAGAGLVLLLAMLVTSPHFFSHAGRIRRKAYDVTCAIVWTMLFLSFLDRFVGPHATDIFLPTVLLLMIAAVLTRFAARFQEEHPALFD